MDSHTAEYLKQLTPVGSLYTLALASKAGLLDAYYKSVIALYEAMAEGALMYTNAAIASFALTAGAPIITMVGVWAALGAGYYQARQEAKNQNTAAGFSQGFVMGILGWKWDQVVSRFRRYHLKINHMDEAMNSIRVNAYHRGLMAGFLAGVALPADRKKEFSSAIRKAGNVRGPKNWDRNADVARNQQITYVIEMATAALRNNIIKPE